jgi:isoleucyl-tRNA synthetase
VGFGGLARKCLDDFPCKHCFSTDGCFVSLFCSQPESEQNRLKKKRKQNKKKIIAKELLPSVSKDIECKINILSEFKGKELEGTVCNHPFYKIGYDYDIPMLEARFVTTEQGTGIS